MFYGDRENMIEVLKELEKDRALLALMKSSFEDHGKQSPIPYGLQRDASMRWSFTYRHPPVENIDLPTYLRRTETKKFVKTDFFKEFLKKNEFRRLQSGEDVEFDLLIDVIQHIWNPLNNFFESNALYADYRVVERRKLLRDFGLTFIAENNEAIEKGKVVCLSNECHNPPPPSELDRYDPWVMISHGIKINSET